MLLHEDYPHTVPTRAYLRWKENWFWVFMDPDSDIYCLAHTTCQPTLGNAFTSFTLIHGGQKYAFTREIPMPERFENQHVLELGDLTIRFQEPQARFQVHFENDELDVTLDLTRRMHLFDFLACYDTNPDQFSVSECTGFGRGEFRHQGQSMVGDARVRFKAGPKAGTTINAKGSGYRDHSWGMRNDAITLDHNWTFINLPNRAFHFFKVRNSVRPELWVREGYVAEAAGNRVLKTLDVEHIGEGPERMPATVRFKVTDVDGTPYTVTCDVGNSMARLPLMSQKPGGKSYYLNVENMCRCRLEETGEEGYANVEIGSLIDS